MANWIKLRVRTALPLIALAVVLLAPGAAQALPVGDPAATAAGDPVYLCALEGNVDLPGAAATPIWGFAQKPAPETACADLTPQLPGPQLEFAAGDAITLDITNAIPGRTLSMDLPGVALDPGPTDIGPGQDIPITFTAPASGTYMYSSSGDAGRQQALGLYGAMVVCASTPCPSSGSENGRSFDRASTLVLSEIDPALNADPDNFNMLDWAPTYWLINGKARPDAPDITAAAGDDVLLRYVSAGPETVTMTMLGMHGRVLARDAYPLDNPIDVVSETLPAGSTADIVAGVPASAAAGSRFPLYNRQLELNNGSYGDSQFAPADGGGMMTFLSVP